MLVLFLLRDEIHGSSFRFRNQEKRWRFIRRTRICKKWILETIDEITCVAVITSMTACAIQNKIVNSIVLVFSQTILSTTLIVGIVKIHSLRWRWVCELIYFLTWLELTLTEWEMRFSFRKRGFKWWWLKVVVVVVAAASTGLHRCYPWISIKVGSSRFLFK